jgi:hypothetical protein
MAIGDRETAVPGPVTVEGAFSGAVDWAIIAVEIKASLAPAPS